MEKLIEKYEEEKRVMLECARLNPREDGSSIYMQLAIMADKKVNALRLAQSIAAGQSPFTPRRRNRL